MKKFDEAHAHPSVRPVWVAGEVLIDLITQGPVTKAIVGGGPANTAMALARLGIETYFLDGISTDQYGQQAQAELLASGVKLEYANFSPKPMCIANVKMNDEGSASYDFLIEDTATFDFSTSWLPTPAKSNISALYVGTLATIVEPGASVLFEWASQVGKNAPIVYDPNIRPSVLSDRARYRHEVDRWVSISSVVKISSEDLSWLYPEQDFADVAKLWFDLGVRLAVLTLGAKGLRAITPTEDVSVPGVHVKVVDTVGAGDTVGAILVEGLVKFGALTGEHLRRVLSRGAVAAAITCSREGARPPSPEEIESFRS